VGTSLISRYRYLESSSRAFMDSPLDGFIESQERRS
jgi:hypothetical protein